MLDLVDDESAGIEGLATVCGTHPNPHGHVAYFQGPDAMNAQRMLHRETPHRFGDDAVAFFHRELLRSFVFQSSDVLSLVLIANPAFETGVAAGPGVLQLGPRLPGVDG